MRNIYVFALFSCIVVMSACSPSKGDRTGHEFMPDMVHSIGYEANLYDFYSYNRWGTEAEYKTYAQPRVSVPGSVARGQISLAGAADVEGRVKAMAAFNGEGDGSIALAPNGSVPYYYGDTEVERARASREIRTNPFPITSAGLAHGKELYNIYCGICHGEKGDGLGYLVREADPAKGIVAGVYPAAPANLLSDTFTLASVGRLYHGIMRGKNVMGSYADKLSYQERWEVIHYIRSLQAQSKKLIYTPDANTYNTEATPWATIEATMKKDVVVAQTDTAAHPEAHGAAKTNHH